MIYSPLCKTAIECALKAGGIVKQGFGTQYDIAKKPGTHNYVTPFDHASELSIVETLKSRYPNHAILAEETGYSDNWQSAEILWVIDPLDGTTNFTHNIPIFSISIAAIKQGTVVCGVIYQPMTDELYVAEKGLGAFLNHQPIHVSKTRQLADGVGATGIPRNVSENPFHCIDSLVQILKLGTLVRNFGSTTINLAYVASGKIDAFWAIALYAWDIAAGKLLIEEAGGNVTSYQGGHYDLLSHTPIVTSNGLVHQELLSYLRFK